MPEDKKRELLEKSKQLLLDAQVAAKKGKLPLMLRVLLAAELLLVKIKLLFLRK